MRTAYDMVVIGGGMAGLNAAQRAVSAGLRVAVVERDRVGGSCPIRGCIPTKALVRSAEIAHEARRAAEFGIKVGEVEVDFAAVMDRVRVIIDKGATATRAWLEGLEGADLFEGLGTFDGPNEVRVNGHLLTAPHIVIATGAVPGRPQIPGLADTPHLTSDDLLQLTELPRRLLVVGAGPIALELGQAFRRLGAAVTMVEVQPRLLPGVEPEFSDRLGEYLSAEGLHINVGVAIERTEAIPEGVRLVMTQGGRERVLEGDALLVAAGRAPATQDLNLGAIGIPDASRGVPTDARLRTTAPGVYAAGDVLGPPWGAFTHVARRLGNEVVDQALGIAEEAVDADLGARAIFTDPELATVGLTEQAARDAGFRVRVGTGMYRGGKSRAWGEERGMVKVVAEAESGRILGAHVLAYHGADLIHPITVAMTQGRRAVDAIRRASHIHPTLGEVVKSAVEAAA